MSERLNIDRSDWNERIPHVVLEGELFEKWGDGVDVSHCRPRPFDMDMWDFCTLDELEEKVADKVGNERADIIRQNEEAMVHNNDEIYRISERALALYELKPRELKQYYEDESTSESDKAIIACIESVRRRSEALGNRFRKNYIPMVNDMTDDELEFAEYVDENIVEMIDGFRIIRAKELLYHADAYFQILSEDERNKNPDSPEDIASLALEEFAVNPRFGATRILDFAGFLHGIMLDCTSRKVEKDENGERIVDNLDLEAFKSRVIESMGFGLIIDKTKTYTEDEIKEISEQLLQTRADAFSGRHFMDEEEEGQSFFVDVKYNDGGFGQKLINDPAVLSEYESVFLERMQENNAELFQADVELAKSVVEPWAEKIDLDAIMEINNDEFLSYGDKLQKIVSLLQSTFEVEYADWAGQSRPIRIDWFRSSNANSKKIIEELFGTKFDFLPERPCSAYYVPGAVYWDIAHFQDTKLSDWDIASVAHEMWHAKQCDIAGIKGGNNSWKDVPVDDLVARRYYLGYMAYECGYAQDRPSGLTKYYQQLIEVEAYAMGREVMNKIQTKRRDAAFSGGAPSVVKSEQI